MTKRVIFILWILSLGMFSCTQKHNLEVDIPEIENDTIYLESYKILNFDETPILDTLYAVNGKFNYDLKIDEPILSQITPKKAQHIKLNKGIYRPIEKSILLILKPEDKIELKGHLDKTSLTYQAKGSLINESYSQMRDTYANFLVEKSVIELKIDSLRFHKGDNDDINALFRKRTKIIRNVNNIQLDYIKNNLDSDLSAYYLTSQPLDTIGVYYKQLHIKAREGVFKDLLASQYNRFEKYTKVKQAELNIKIGNKAPNFSLKNSSGETITVDYSGDKFTVLDFWGSWCSPCIAGFPKMKSYFQNNSDIFNFIGIACNDKEENWKNAIKTYDLKWENLFNTKNNLKDVSVIFAVKEYPTKIIIDSNGIIEGIFEGEGNDFYKKLDELIQNLQS